MAGHSSLDQGTLQELWKIAQEAEEATKNVKRVFKNIFIRTYRSHLQVHKEQGFMDFFYRYFFKKSYVLEPGSPTAQLLMQLNSKTIDLSEQSLIKAIASSPICKDGLMVHDVLAKIKSGCRTVNHILQHAMERKIEHAIEEKQEGIKLFFSGLFLPNWGLADARRAEIQRAADELKRAQAAAMSKSIDNKQKIQAYLDAATAQLNVAMTGKEEAEEILKQAKAGRTIDTVEVAALKAKECAQSADEAVFHLQDIVRQADSIVKSKETNPILNFGEIEELKRMREILNILGQVAEYAQSAKNAASEVVKLALR